MLSKIFKDHKPEEVHISSPQVGMMKMDWTPDTDYCTRVQWMITDVSNKDADDRPSQEEIEKDFDGNVAGEVILSKGLSVFLLVEGVAHGQHYACRVCYMDDNGVMGSWVYAE